MNKLRLFILTLVLMLAWNVAQAKDKPVVEEKQTKVTLISLQKMINPGTSDFITRAIEKSRENGSECLLIELDTPGGLLDSTRDIVKAFLNSDIPIVVYVGPSGARAGSAGVFITLAAHIAVMAPGTNIGAAHPVSGTGKDPEKEGGKHMAEKIENDTAAFIETIANQRHRNVEWAKEAVLKSVSITERKALELKVIDFIAKDRQELLDNLHGKEIELLSGKKILNTKQAKIENLEMSWKQYFVDLFSNPNIAFFLILIATVGIYLELSHPGAILPGVAAALSIILILLTSQTLPFNTGGLLLMVLGIVFFILEVYVTSYGMLALGGIICFVMGSLLLFDVDQSMGFFGISRSVIFVSGATLGAFVAATAYVISRSQKTKAITGYEGLIGSKAEVVSELSPDGKVLLDGEFWNATATSPIAVGEKVRVIKAEGLLLYVEPIHNQKGN